MTNSAKLYFKGYKIRGVNKPSVSRDEFKKKINELINKSVELSIADAIAKNNGNDIPPLMKDAIRNKVTTNMFRALGRQYSFFLAVWILKLDFLDTDYGYRLCMDVDANKWNVNLWVIAREHFKSTIITCLSTLREILNDSNLTYCIISFTPDVAAGFLKIIKNWVDGDGEGSKFLRALYSDVIWSDPMKGYQVQADGSKKYFKWNSTELNFKRATERQEPTVGIGGVEGGSITGKHFARLIFDDLETRDSVTTTSNIERIVDNVTNLFRAGQAENLMFVLIGTFYAREDVYCRLIKTGIVSSSVIQPCYEDDNVTSIRFSPDKMAEAMKTSTPVTWATQYLCDPSMSNQNSFDAAWFRYWGADRWDDLNVYTVVDPAKTRTNKSDYTAIVTFGVTSRGSMMILDVIRDKLLIDQKFSALCTIKRKYNPLMIFYEENGLANDVATMNILMDKYHLYFPIQSYSTHGNKEERISNTIPSIKSCDILFPEHSYHMNWQGVMEDMMESVVRDEFMTFPKGEHDDGIDAISMGLEFIMSGVCQKPEEQPSTGNVRQIEYDEDPMKYAIECASERLAYL